jgi:hypothetical protein
MEDAMLNFRDDIIDPPQPEPEHYAQVRQMLQLGRQWDTDSGSDCTIMSRSGDSGYTLDVRDIDYREKVQEELERVLASLASRRTDPEEFLTALANLRGIWRTLEWTGCKVTLTVQPAT